MENMVAFDGFYNKRSVLVTGHTGFKGSWLMEWLLSLGADVSGYSLSPPTNPSHYRILKHHERVRRQLIADIRDWRSLDNFVHGVRPEIIFHLAAQSLVRPSYDNPVGTFDTNVMGTVNVLDVARKCTSVKSIVIVTSDKVYKTGTHKMIHTERDQLGGNDPYSASKACCELVVKSYRKSFGLPVATARAGNVIGGGDWALERLVPDSIHAKLSGSCVQVRQPLSIRPWQHVLDPLSGYLLLAQNIFSSESHRGESFNFGPSAGPQKTVADLLNQLKIPFKHHPDESKPESHFLALDSQKAKLDLNWSPRINFAQTCEMTLKWYERWANKKNPAQLTRNQIENYFSSSSARASSISLISSS